MRLGTWIKTFVAASLGFALQMPAASGAPDIAKIERGVVRVVTRMSRGVGTGTGFILNNAGYIATNNHVVQGGQSYSVYLSGSTRQVSARVIWKDANLDLAVLLAEGVGGDPITVTSSVPQKSESVIAIGFPGLADRLGTARDATVTNGNLSRVFDGRWQRRTLKILQHSAQINPGNSGGPLFDNCGRVIGVNTQGSSAGRIVRDAQGRVKEVMAGTGIFFASSVNELTRELTRLGVSSSINGTRCSASAVGSDPAAIKAAQDAQAAADAIRLENEAIRASAADAQGALETMNQRIMTFGPILALLSVAAIIFGLRKPRQQVIRVANEYKEQLSRRLSRVTPSNDGARSRRSRRSSAAQSSRSGSSGASVFLSGFDRKGRTVRMEARSEDLGRDTGGASIGRHPAVNHMVINDNQVSKRHARVVREGGQLYAEDLNSSNGTQVNGKRLSPFQPQPVRKGDQISIAGLEFLIS